MEKAILIDGNTTVYFISFNGTPSGVTRIAHLVARDLEMVTECRTVFTDEIGDGVNIIYGINPFDDDLTGKNEVYKFTPNLSDNSISIVGVDKRGAIYGLFHLSDMLGVSPFVNWSNVVPPKTGILVTDEDAFISKEPSVKYRGFFINDEWPAFGNWCMEHFGGFTAEMYAGVFEILLRMKGNYLWPAMWSSCFSEDGPGLRSAELANELGVVMGLSHHEPCLRHGEEYSHVRGEDSIYGDAWDFRENREGIINFWRDGLARSGQFENVITVGMRGERDSKILGDDASLKDNIDLLRDVLKTQNQLISEEVNPVLSQVPRMLALYKEVEPYYYGNDQVKGLMDEPELDGVTLLLCDDNHGYVRSLPNYRMKNHNGGFGMYYHFDYHGEPISYEWINSTHLPEVWEQMTTTYEHGVKDIWIVNVGDLGLNELPLQYFLSLAYDYDKWGITNPNSTTEFTEYMMNLHFSGAFEDEDLALLRGLYTRYTRLIHNRRPEHLDENVYHPQNYYEATLILKEAEDLSDICNKLLDKCSAEYKDSFIELIAYNVLAGTNHVKLWIYRTFNHFFASIGCLGANDYIELIKDAIATDDELREMFHKAANGKWSGFGLAEHIGFKHWNSEESAYPILETVLPVRRPEIKVGLMGEIGVTSGQEWSGKQLTVSNYLVKSVRSLKTIIFVGLAGDRDVPFTIESNSSYVKFVSPSKVSLDAPLSFIEVEIEKRAWDSSETPELKVKYELGEVVIKLLPQNDDIYFCNADAFTAENQTLKGEMQVIRGIGRRESGVKLLPVTTSILDPKDSPSLDYEFEIKNAGTYKVLFQMLPTNPYTFGKDLWMAYAVNPDEAVSTEYSTYVKKILNGSEYKPGESKDWWDGVLSHVRYVDAEIHLHEGTNIIRYFPLSRENVLERVILVREGVELPDSYLGPIM